MLGSLSPRTRNAQVALYQAGDVDYLVATDAIGIHEPPFLGLERSKWTLGLALSTQHRPLGYAVDDIIGAAIADGRMERIFADHGVTYLPAVR